MPPPETRIEMERRHLRLAEAHVIKQRALLARMQALLLPTDMAEDLLSQFESSVEAHRSGLLRLEEEQRVGLRDSDGNIIPGR